MFSSDTYNFVAGDENLDLHRLFSFTEAEDLAVTAPAPTGDLLAPTGDLLAPPLLGSLFAGPLEDLQGQPSWLSPSGADPVDGLDAVNFDEFLALESTDDVLAPAEEALTAPPPPPPPPPPQELAGSGTPQGEAIGASEPTGDLSAAAELEAVRDEIAQLKAALAAGYRQNSSSPRKRKLDGGEVSPPKRQTTSEIGPIEALWSRKVTKDEHRAATTNLAPPATPEPPSPQLCFTAPPSTPPINSQDDVAISRENLLSLQQFLNEDPALVHEAFQQVDTSTPPSDINMAHLVNTKAKRLSPKSAPKRVPKNTSNIPNKVTKKVKTTPKKKTQHQRNVSTASNITPSPASSSHRTIDELLTANFYSLDAQEKLRLMLPMLRNLDPRELENKLAVLPCIQAKGTGHEVTVAKAIRDSPPTPEDDYLLANKLTFGTRSPAPAARGISSSPPAPTTPAIQASLLSHKVSHVEVSADYGAVRQREALEKAAALQAQGKRR